MIIFHEGMPRSGKSYAAIKDHLVPALAKGRKCYVHIDGINLEKLAPLCGRTVQELENQIVSLSADQVRSWLKIDFEQDAFIFVDEAQDYWQRSRQPLSDEMMSWIAKHGHHGYDVLLMGQLLKDVHSAWVNRTNRKLQFIKRDVVGKENEYTWIMFHGSPDANGNVKFREVSRGKDTYDEKYFGTYKSHSDGTDNKANYVDDRANIFKTAVFRKWVPLYGAVALVALWYVYHAFTGGLAKSTEKPPEAPAKAQAVPDTKAAPIPQNEPRSPAQPVQTQEYKDGKMVGTRPMIIPANEVQPAYQPDYIEQLSNRYRVRLGGLIRGARHTEGVIEWRDESDGVMESLSLRDVSGMGWLLLLSPDGTVGTLQKADRRYVVTQWPLRDTKGRLTASQTEQLRPAGAAPLVTAGRAEVVASASPSTFVLPVQGSGQVAALSPPTKP